jgi:hypothetical protein
MSKRLFKPIRLITLRLINAQQIVRMILIKVNGYLSLMDLTKWGTQSTHITHQSSKINLRYTMRLM